MVAMDEHNVVLVKDVEDIDQAKLQEKLSSIAVLSGIYNIYYSFSVFYM